MAKPVKLVFLADDTQLRKALSKLVGDAGSAQAALKAMEKTGADMHRVGRTMTVGFTLPVALAAGAAVALGTQYEATMTKIETLAGASAQQVKTWSTQLINLGPALGQTPEQLADALYFIVSGGIKASDALDVLTVSAKSSAIGLGDAKVVADALTSVLNAYGPTAITAGRAGDILLRAVKDGKGEAADFAASIGLVIPIAAQLKVPFSDIAAGMASLTLTGSSAAEASTQLRGVLSKILHPSKEVSGALSQFGMNTKDLQKRLAGDGLLKTLQYMKDKVGGNTEAFGKLFPEVKGLLGVLSLVGPNGQHVADVFKDVAGAGGDVNKAFDRTKQTRLWQMKSALSALAGEGIKLGDRLAPAVTKAAEWIVKLVKSFDGMHESTKSTIITVVGLVAALGPLLFVGGGLMKMFTGLAKHPIITALAMLTIAFITAYTHNAKFRDTVHHVIAALKDAWKWIQNNKTVIMSLAGGIGSFLAIARGASALSHTFGFITILANNGKLLGAVLKGGVSSGIKVVTTAWKLLNSSFLASPIGLIIALIVGLGIAFYIAYTHSAAFRKFVNTALHEIAKVAKVVWDALVVGAKATWQWIDQHIIPVFKAVGHVISVAFGGIMKVLGPVLHAVGVLAHGIGEVFKVFSHAVTSHWGVIKKILMVLGLVMMPIIIPILLIVAAFKRFHTQIFAVLQAVWTVISFVFKAVITVIVFFVKIILAVLIPVFKVLWAVVSFVAKVIWAILSGLFSLLWAIIKAFVTVLLIIWTGLWKVISVVVKAAFDIVLAIIIGVATWFKKKFDEMKAVVTVIWEIISLYLRMKFDQIKSLFTQIWDAIHDVFKKFWDKFHDTATGGANKLKDGVIGIFNKVKDAVKGVWDGVSDAAKTAINGAIKLVNMVKIPPITIAGQTVFDGWKGFQIPLLANGGIINKPTLAMVGEAGKELVLPLTRPDRAASLLEQSGILSRIGGGSHAVSGTTHIDKGKTVNVHIGSIVTQAKTNKEIGEEIAWQARVAAL